MNFYDTVANDFIEKRVSPAVFAVFSLLNARRYSLDVCHDLTAFGVLDSAVWSIVNELTGAELDAALTCVHLDNFRSNARLISAAHRAAGVLSGSDK